MFTVYILKSLKDGRTYTGFTENLTRRLVQHNHGKVHSTKKRIPLVLIHSENFFSKKEAKDREKWWKSSVGRKKMKDLLF